MLQGYMYRKHAPNPQTPFTQRNRLSNRLSNRFDNRLNACLHNAAVLTTGWTTGSIVYANIQPVVQPVVHPLVRFDNNDLCRVNEVSGNAVNRNNTISVGKHEKLSKMTLQVHFLLSV